MTALSVAFDILPNHRSCSPANLDVFFVVVDEETGTVIVTLTGFTSDDHKAVLDSDESRLTVTVNLADASQVTSIDVGGPAVNFAAGTKPIKVLPQAVVAGHNPGGGTLIINVNEVTAGQK